MKANASRFIRNALILILLTFSYPFLFSQNITEEERADDPGARQCEFHGHRAAGAWSEGQSPAHSLRYAKDKHHLERIVGVPISSYYSNSISATQPENGKNFWRPLGPFTLNMTGYGYGSVSGRVTDFAFAYDRPQPRVFSATANGGLWYSDDQGEQWHHFKNYFGDVVEVESMKFNADVMSCGAVAVTPDGNKVFVGTGEGSRYAADCQLAYEGYSYEGIGVLVSLNGGQTWEIEPSEPDLTGHAFFGLAMDPANYDKIVGATSNGLYLRMPDTASPTGFSWRRQKMGPENNSVSSVVVARKGNKTTFYAARWGGMVFQSSDGIKWRRVSSGSFPDKWAFHEVTQDDKDRLISILTNDDPWNIKKRKISKELALYNAVHTSSDLVLNNGTNTWTVTDTFLKHNFIISETGSPFISCQDYSIGRIALAVQPDNPDIVYAVAAGQEENAGGLFGLYRIDMKGDKLWHAVRNGSSDYNYLYALGEASLGRGWWQMAFAVDPANVNRLFIAGVLGFKVDVSSAANASTIFSGNPTMINNVHTDIHILKFQPDQNGTQDSNKLWLGCDGGVYHAENATASPPVFSAKNAGLPTFLLENFDHHPVNDAIIYTGTQDNEGLKYSGSPVWEPVFFGDQGNIVIDWSNPDTNVIGNYIGGSFDRIGNYKAPLKDIETSYNWEETYSDRPMSLVYAPLVGTPYNPTNPNEAKRIAFGANQVYISDDFGSNWKSIGTMAGNGPGDRIKALTFASYDKIYAGTMDGQVYRFTENPTSKIWVKERLDLRRSIAGSNGYPNYFFPKVPVTSIAVDPADAAGNSIYLTLGGAGSYRRVWHFQPGTREFRWTPVSGPNPVNWDDTSVDLNVQSGYSPSMVDFKGKMYLAYVAADQGKTGSIYLSVSTNGENWNTPVKILDEVQTNQPVELVVHQESLFLAYTGTDQSINLASSADGQTWQVAHAKVRNLKSIDPVHAVSWQGTLYLSYSDINGWVHLISYNQKNGWTDPWRFEKQAYRQFHPVDLAVYRGKLAATWNDDFYSYVSYSEDGMLWTKGFNFLHQYQKHPVALLEYEGLFYQFYNWNSDNKIHSNASELGYSWPESVLDPDFVQSKFYSTLQIAPAILDGRLFMAFVDKSSGNLKIARPADAIKPGLPSVQHNSIVVDPQHPETLYAGTDVGVYYSTDAGISWMPFSNGLPGVPVNYLKIYPAAGPNGQAVTQKPDNQRFLRAATYGRSMFERTLDATYDNSSAQLYIRKNDQDRGLYDVPQGEKVNNSPDVKICYPNSIGEYPFPPQANFYQFAEIPDGMAYVGNNSSEAKDISINDGANNRTYLKRPPNKDKFRLYTQIQNHGIVWSDNMSLYVLACTQGQLADLPDNFASELKSWQPGTVKGNWKLLKKNQVSGSEITNREQGIPYVFGMDLEKRDLPAPAVTRLLLVVDSDGVPFRSNKKKVKRLCRTTRQVAVKTFNK